MSQQNTPVARIFIDLSSGVIHEVLSNQPVEVLIINDDLDMTDDPRMELASGAVAGYQRYRLDAPANPAESGNGIDEERVEMMFDFADAAEREPLDGEGEEGQTE